VNLQTVHPCQVVISDHRIRLECQGTPDLKDDLVNRWRWRRHLLGVRHHPQPGRPRRGLQRGLCHHPGHEEEDLHVSPLAQGTDEMKTVARIINKFLNKPGT